MSFVWTTDNPLVTTDSNYTASGSYLPGIPNVPNWPGVPQLARSAAGTGIGIVGGAEVLASELGLNGVVSFGNRLYSSIELDLLSAGPLPQYAFLGGKNNSTSVLQPDSVVEVDVHASVAIMTHPIEKGSFSAYNLVQDPKRLRLLLACTGQGQLSRSGFLTLLELMRENGDLITIATPDASYKHMALTSYGYRKSAEHGAVTIWADTTWMEARSTGVTVSAPPTSQPFGSAVSPLGSVQLQALTPQQLATVNNPSTQLVPLPSIDAGAAPPSGAAS